MIVYFRNHTIGSGEMLRNKFS